jgi:hypothetical protein
MPVRRTQLSREEKARYLSRVQDLRSAGVDCELPDELQQSSRSLDILVGPSEANILCELPIGGTAYAIWVRLVALVGNLFLESVAIQSDWDPESIVLSSHQRGLYRLEPAVSLTEKEVLNHRFENGLRFHRPGDVAEGWVVASGLRSIPDKYLDWMNTKLTLTFTDQFGDDHSKQAEASVQRSAHLRDSDVRVQKSQAAAFPAVCEESEIISPDSGLYTDAGASSSRLLESRHARPRS